MEHTNVLYYADVVEVTRYERRPEPRNHKRRGSRNADDVGGGIALQQLSFDGEVVERQEERKTVRSEDDARRAVLVFRRLAYTNIKGLGNPVLASFTYKENMVDFDTAREDWRAFAKRATTAFGSSFRYICVTEFQERGAIHYHALLWGIPQSVIASERYTRLVASLWGKGFTDLRQTDGSTKLATYLSKYTSKTFSDIRLSGRRAYTTSRDILRPVLDRGAVLAMYFQGDLQGVPDLSTGVVAYESEYDTLSLGRANYKKYLILGKHHANSNAQ